MTANFEQANQYALHRLERELSPNLLYHSLKHTRDDVVPAAERLAKMEGLQGEPFSLLMTAAWFHDVGFVEQPQYHELISARIALQVLPGFGFSEEQIEIIRWAIYATALPQDPKSLLDEIMVDADLDNLGRDDFMQRNLDFRGELARHGREFGDQEWIVNQIKFVEPHTYFTASARALRAEGQAKNVAELKTMLEAFK